MEASKQRALVTGASSGLGREIARVLAERGVDLTISARRVERLDELAGQLREECRVDVSVLSADLAQPDGARRLFENVQAAGKKIDILINNAGFGCFGPMLEQSVEQIDEVLAVNVVALTRLTRLFAQTMKEQGGGYILLVSSYAALQPIPGYAVYSGTKAYAIALGQALRHELRRAGVRISIVAPGFMPTEFHEVSHHRKTLLMKLTSVPTRHVARRAVAGMFRGKLLITPGVVYQVNNWLLPLLPRRVASAISAAIVKS